MTDPTPISLLCFASAIRVHGIREGNNANLLDALASGETVLGLRLVYDPSGPDATIGPNCDFTVRADSFMGEGR